MEVIDGQQRITTLVIIAAVAQHMLLGLAEQITDDCAEEKKAVQEVCLSGGPGRCSGARVFQPGS